LINKQNTQAIKIIKICTLLGVSLRVLAVAKIVILLQSK